MIWIIALVLLFTSPVSSTSDTSFFTSGGTQPTTLWLVENAKATPIFSVSGTTPLPLAAFSPHDQAYFANADVMNPFEYRRGSYLTGVSPLPGNRFLLTVQRSICAALSLFSNCAGYTEFMLLYPDGYQRTLLRVDYHDREILDRWQCGRTNMIFAGVHDINQTKDQFIVSMTVDDRYCMQQPFVNVAAYLLVDFSGETRIEQEIEFADHVMWSPDGERLTYLNQIGCLDRSSYNNYCRGVITIRSANGTIQELTPVTNNPTAYVEYFGEFHWQDATTLVFTQAGGRGDPPLNEVVTYNVERNTAHVSAYYELTPQQRALLQPLDQVRRTISSIRVNMRAESCLSTPLIYVSELDCVRVLGNLYDEERVFSNLTPLP